MKLFFTTTIPKTKHPPLVGQKSFPEKKDFIHLFQCKRKIAQRLFRYQRFRVGTVRGSAVPFWELTTQIPSDSSPIVSGTGLRS